MDRYGEVLLAVAGLPLPPVVSFTSLLVCSGDGSGDNTVANSNVNTCTRLFLDNVVRIHS